MRIPDRRILALILAGSAYFAPGRGVMAQNLGGIPLPPGPVADQARQDSLTLQRYLSGVSGQGASQSLVPNFGPSQANDPALNQATLKAFRDIQAGASPQSVFAALQAKFPDAFTGGYYSSYGVAGGGYGLGGFGGYGADGSSGGDGGYALFLQQQALYAQRRAAQQEYDDQQQGKSPPVTAKQAEALKDQAGKDQAGVKRPVPASKGRMKVAKRGKSAHVAKPARKAAPKVPLPSPDAVDDF